MATKIDYLVDLGTSKEDGEKLVGFVHDLALTALTEGQKAEALHLLMDYALVGAAYVWSVDGDK